MNKHRLSYDVGVGLGLGGWGVRRWMDNWEASRRWEMRWINTHLQTLRHGTGRDELAIIGDHHELGLDGLVEEDLERASGLSTAGIDEHVD